MTSITQNLSDSTSQAVSPADAASLNTVSLQLDEYGENLALNQENFTAFTRFKSELTPRIEALAVKLIGQNLMKDTLKSTSLASANGANRYGSWEFWKDSSAPEITAIDEDEITCLFEKYIGCGDYERFETSFPSALLFEPEDGPTWARQIAHRDKNLQTWRNQISTAKQKTEEAETKRKRELLAQLKKELGEA